MKAYVFVLLLVSGFSMQSLTTSAQVCEIDTNNFSLFSPVSDDLPCIIRDSNYYAVLQFFCPPVVAGSNIDSIVVTGIWGFPQGISYECYPPTCSMPGNARACVAITGTTLDTAGGYDLVYDGFIYAQQGTATFAQLRSQGFLPEYSLKVINQGTNCRGANPTGITELSNTAFSISPNPGRVFGMQLTTETKNAICEVLDVNGNLVMNSVIQQNTQMIDLTNSPKGIYLVRLVTEQGISAQRIVVE